MITKGAGNARITGVKAYNDFSEFPTNGSESIIYIDKANNELYLWDGATYLKVSTNPTGILALKGIINVNTDFPLLADVETGDSYVIGTNVTDDAGGLYTDTDQSFLVGDSITWSDDLVDGKHWIVKSISELVSDQVSKLVQRDETKDVEFSQDFDALVGGNDQVFDVKDYLGNVGSRISSVGDSFLKNFLTIGSDDLPTAILSLAASTTNNASLNIKNGVAPTSINQGDFYNVGGSLFYMDANGTPKELSNSSLNTKYVNLSSEFPDNPVIDGRYVGGTQNYPITKTNEVILDANIENFIINLANKIDLGNNSGARFLYSQLFFGGQECITSDTNLLEKIYTFISSTLASTTANSNILKLKGTGRDSIFVKGLVALVAAAGGNIGSIEKSTGIIYGSQIRGFRQGIEFINNFDTAFALSTLEGSDQVGNIQCLIFGEDTGRVNIPSVAFKNGTNEYAIYIDPDIINPNIVLNGCNVDNKENVFAKGVNDLAYTGMTTPFTKGLIVTGSVSGAQGAITRKYNNYLLGYSSLIAPFTVGQIVTGQTSGAKGTIISDVASVLTVSMETAGLFEPTENITDPLGGDATLDTNAEEATGTIRVFSTNGIPFTAGVDVLSDTGGGSANLTTITNKDSLDQTDIGVKCIGNVNIPDSTALVNANAIDQGDISTITNQNEIIRINASFTEQLSERFSLTSSGTSEYLGNEEIKGQIILFITGTTSSGVNIPFNFYIAGGNSNNTIVSLADAGGGQITVTTSLPHGYSNGDRVVIEDTPNNDGGYTISNITSLTFEITSTFVATATGNHFKVFTNTKVESDYTSTSRRQIGLVADIEIEKNDTSIICVERNSASSVNWTTQNIQGSLVKI